MDRLPAFELLHPASVAEAAALLAAPGARLLAGGTDLLPNLRRGLERPATLVDLSGVAGLDAITRDADGLTLGAGVNLARLASEDFGEAWRAVSEAARQVAAPSHRNAATVGGNLCLDTRCIYYNQSEWWRAANGYCLKRGGDTCHVAPQGSRCHAAFSGDLAPALITLGAEVELVSAQGSRRLPLAQLYRDDGAAHLTLAPGELLTTVHLPAAARGTRSAYRKARVRGAVDFPLAGVAIALQQQDGHVAAIAVALTGTNSHPLALGGVDAFVGRQVDDAMLVQLGKLVAKQVSPMRSTVTAANYRRQVASVLAQRLLRELAGLPLEAELAQAAS